MWIVLAARFLSQLRSFITDGAVVTGVTSRFGGERPGDGLVLAAADIGEHRALTDSQHAHAYGRPTHHAVVQLAATPLEGPVMRLYYTGASPNNMRRARQHAPSHTHGYGWTPNKYVAHDGPYFLDHGYTDHFNPDEYRELIDWALTEHPADPDFFVLPDVYGAAEGTIQLHQTWLYERQLPVGSGQCMRYWVLQPGLPIAEQFEAIEGCQGVFVGGPVRWKRAHGDEIVRLANDRGLRTHVGKPGGADGPLWAYRTGFDSCDTTTVFQNQYWHYLKKLEQATEETTNDAPDKRSADQAALSGWSA